MGVIICAGVRLTNNIKVGNFSILNLNATVGHDTIIEHFVNVAPGKYIWEHTYRDGVLDWHWSSHQSRASKSTDAHWRRYCHW